MKVVIFALLVKWVIFLMLVLTSPACNNHVDVKGQLPNKTAPTDESTSEQGQEASTEQTMDKSKEQPKDKKKIEDTEDDKKEMGECEDGKICRGMTKDDILELVGDPDDIEILFGREEWVYIEMFGKEKLCRQGWSEFLDSHCRIIFKDGLVVDEEDVRTSYIDVKNY